MIDKQVDFIAKFNAQAGSDVLPLPIPDQTGDYTIPNWDWRKLIWRKIEKQVFNLQKRIYKATKAGQLSKAKSLMKLLYRSTSTIILGIRRITQDNQGKRSAGIDGIKANTPAKRERMAKCIIDKARNGFHSYRAKPAKRKYIPKANGKLRPLGIPTQEDRVIQYVVKTALEPHYEALFEPCSYGFRPAMSTHDAIEAIWNATRLKPKWVLDADIKGCFDNINHSFIIEQIDIKWQPLIRKWLKAGYIDEGQLHPTKSGTPQGGIISPLLANIALDNLERYLVTSLREIKGWKSRIGNPNRPKLRVIRYADDFVVIHKDKEVIDKAQEVIHEWTRERGLELSPEKTRIVDTTLGFDFLGCTIKHYKNDKIKGNYKKALLKADDNGKSKRRVEKELILQITPSKEKVLKHKEQVAEICSQMKAASQDALIKRLNPVIRGWANYYRYINSSQTFSELDSYLWQKLWRWSCRRHPMKGKRWVKDRYFPQSKRRLWDFKTKENQIQWYSYAKAPVGSYIKVKEGKSYYDGDTLYWAKRLRSGYDTISPSKAKLLRKQDGKCPVCGGLFRSGDLIEKHHIKAKRKGGEDKYSNLALLHRHCHDQLHAANVSSVKKNNKKGLCARIKGRIFGDVT